MPNTGLDTCHGKEHVIQPLRDSQYSVKGAVTEQHREGMEGRGQFPFPGKLGENALKRRQAGFFK